MQSSHKGVRKWHYRTPGQCAESESGGKAGTKFNKVKLKTKEKLDAVTSLLSA